METSLMRLTVGVFATVAPAAPAISAQGRPPKSTNSIFSLRLARRHVFDTIPAALVGPKGWNCSPDTGGLKMHPHHDASKNPGLRIIGTRRPFLPRVVSSHSSEQRPTRTNSGSPFTLHSQFLPGLR